MSLRRAVGTMSRHPLVVFDPTIPLAPARAKRHPDWPPTRAALAAFRQGPAPGRRYLRELRRRALVLGQDVRSEPVLVDVAVTVGLSLARMRRDWYDEDGLLRDAPSLAPELLV